MVLFCRQAKRDGSPLVQCADRVVRSEPHIVISDNRNDVHSVEFFA